MSRTEEYIERAVKLRDAGFTTKAAQKDALGFLNRAYDIIRNEANDLYRDMVFAVAGDDFDARREMFNRRTDLPYSLAHYRAAKHELSWEGNLSHKDTVARLVTLREEIKAMPVNKPETREQRERAILQRSEIPTIAAQFEPLKQGVKQDFINQFRNGLASLLERYNNDWAALNGIRYNSYDINEWLFVSGFLKINNSDRNGPREVNEERLDKAATQYAEDQINSFVHKLALKLVDLKNVELHNVRPHSFQFELTGDLDGQAVEVRQNIKYGVSKLRTPYVQWPALIYVDGQRVSELEFQKIAGEL